MTKQRSLDLSNIESELKSLFVDIARCRANRLKRSAKVREDLGIDSFTALEILVAVDPRFTINIRNYELDKLPKFGAVSTFILKKISSKNKNGLSGFL